MSARQSGKKRNRGGRWTKALVFIMPALLGFLLFMAYPIVMSLYYSFTEFDGSSDPVWVGIDKYRDLAADSLLWRSLFITLLYTFIAVPLGMVVALVLAMLLNLKLRGQSFYRTLFFLPSIIPMVATAVLWVWLLHPQYGAINGIIRLFGCDAPGWLSDPAWALPALILMSLWSVGGNMVLYMASLQDVPAHLYEAAEIDGAGFWSKTRHVTIPMMSPVLFFTMVMGLIGGFQYFTQAWVMTNGGPGDATRFYCLYLFEKAFLYKDMGGASAMAWGLFVVILLVTLAVFRFSRRFVHYEGS